jgi:Transposase DDE domain
VSNAKNLPVEIKNDLLLFDKLLEPIEEVLAEYDATDVSQSAKILKFGLFSKLLFFRLFARIETLRDFVQDLESESKAQHLGFFRVGLSTFHDAFARYRAAIFAEIFALLADRFRLEKVPELAALGQISLVDSSFFAVSAISWLAREGVRGVRLHLEFSLNNCQASEIYLTADKAPTTNERNILIKMAKAGVTFVMDRGYVSLEMCVKLIEAGAYFVLRERNTLKYRVLAENEVEVPKSLRMVKNITDLVIKLDRETAQAVFRLVKFEVLGHQFQILTNRFDVATSEIIILYAWRWQVELIFRAWKHTLKGLHLINLSENGIKIQFYVLAIGAYLYAILAQKTEVQKTAREKEKKPKKTLTGRLGEIFQVRWRLRKRPLRLVKNYLSKPFSVYLQKLIEQQV